MNNFEFYAPTKVCFGKGTASMAGECVKQFGGGRVMVHYGSGRVRETGLLAQVESSLRDAGLEFILFGGAVPNPRVSLVREGAALAKKENIDFILAVGGGSVIDSAKGIAMAAVNDCDIWDIYTGKTMPAGALPTGNILTIAAAGSETSEHTVLTNEDGWVKIGYAYEKLRPAFTIMDPELMFSLPPYQTASGVVDILIHTMERYFSPGGRNEMTDRIAEEVMRVTVRYGKKCVEEPQNYEARSEVMWAGSLSHNDLTGLGREGDWASHMLEHELSGKFDVTHGAGLAAVWPTWARYVYHADPMRFVRYGARVWDLPVDYSDLKATALEAIGVTEEFFKSLSMPVTITELLNKEITSEDISDMAEKCTRGGTKTIGGFMKLGREQIEDIYRMAT